MLPGPWNNHSYLTDLLPDPEGTLRDKPLPRATIRAGRNAMDALKAGFRSLRMTCAQQKVGPAVRDLLSCGSQVPLNGKAWKRVDRSGRMRR